MRRLVRSQGIFAAESLLAAVFWALENLGFIARVREHVPSMTRGVRELPAAIRASERLLTSVQADVRVKRRLQAKCFIYKTTETGQISGSLRSNHDFSYHNEDIRMASPQCGSSCDA